MLLSREISGNPQISDSYVISPFPLSRKTPEQGITTGMRFRTRVKRRKEPSKQGPTRKARAAARRAQRRRWTSFNEVAGITNYCLIAGRKFHLLLDRKRMGKGRKMENITVGLDREQVAEYREWMKKQTAQKKDRRPVLRRRMSGSVG